MLNPEVSLSNLCALLDSKIDPALWATYQPETLMIELDSYEPLLLEKIRTLQVLVSDVSNALSKPEFLLWMSQVANNDHAEFENIVLPNCLELAWAIVEAKKIAALLGQKFEPSEELSETVAFILKEEGFSKPVPPFEFVPQSLLEEGQLEDDTLMKTLAISTYLAHMEAKSHD